MDGRTAADRHEQWRQRFPEQVDKGDDGERWTALLLADLPESWVVLHRVFPRNRKFDIDHLLIGPGGVIALDSKNYTGRVTLNNDTLWTGKFPRNDELDAAQTHADYAAAVLGVDTTPVLCVHTAQLPAGHFAFRDIDVLSPDSLLQWLRSRPTLLLQMQVVAIAAAAQARFDILGQLEPQKHVSVSSSPMAPPPPIRLPPASPPTSAPAPPPPAPPSGRSSRPSQYPGRHRRKPIARSLVAAAITIVLAPIMYVAMSAFIHSWGRSIAKSVQTSTVASTVPMTPTGPAALQAGRFSCPGQGRRWTLTVPAPQPAASYQAQWSQAPEGPWSAPATWQAGSPLSIAGLQEGSRVFIRVGPTGAMTMQKTPSQPC